MYYKIGYLDGSRVDEWLHGAVLEFGRPGARHRKEIKRKIKTKSGIKRNNRQKWCYSGIFAHTQRL